MDLKFDEMCVNTNLAKEYVEKEKEFSRLYTDYEELTSYVFDGTFQRKPKVQLNNKNVDQRAALTGKLQDLALTIGLSEKLISELEYMFRKIPIEDTKAQVNLISKHLMAYNPILESQEIINSHEVNIHILPEDPLLIFGNIKRIVFSKYITFIATKATAYMAYYFAKLSQDCGIDVRLQFTNDEKLPLRTNKGWDSGTVAVVSEDADIDSAVDKLLASSKLAPWRLKRILVQENVYQQFKDALTWKCNLKEKKDETIVSNILCSGSVSYDRRTFIIDPVELLNDKQAVVPVEAFRTRKEMLLMVQKSETHYLSLWSNGIAGINEASYKSGSPVVWVNNLAEFRGPPQMLNAIYTDMFDELKIKKSVSIGALVIASKEWRQMGFEKRERSLHRLIEKIDVREVANNISEALVDCNMKSFVDEGDDYVCVGKSSPVGIILVPGDKIFTPKTFKSLLYGNVILALTENLKIRELFQSVGVPLEITKQVDPAVGDDNGTSVHVVLDSSFKAIWTNSGTIFAN